MKLQTFRKSTIAALLVLLMTTFSNERASAFEPVLAGLGVSALTGAIMGAGYYGPGLVGQLIDAVMGTGEEPAEPNPPLIFPVEPNPEDNPVVVEQPEQPAPSGETDGPENTDNKNTEIVDTRPVSPVSEKVAPALDASDKAILTAGQNLARASGQLTMNGLSGMRHLMDHYRSGTAIDGVASIDDASTTGSQELSRRSWNTGEVGDWHTFVQVYGIQGSQDAYKSLPGASFRGYGLNTGIFNQVNDDLIAGVMLGTQRTNLSFSKVPGSASQDTLRFGPFLSWSKNDWHLDAAVLISENQYDLSRRAANDQKLHGNYTGTELSGYLAVGYDIHLDDRWPGLTVTPLAEVLAIENSSGGFSEKGRSPQALKVKGSSHQQVITRLGTEIKYVFPEAELPTMMNVSLGWQRQDISGGKSAYRQPGQDAQGQFKVPGFSDGGLFMGLSFSQQVSEQSNLSLGYMGTQTARGMSHGLQLSYELKF